MLSIVIPTLNEEKTGFLQRMLNAYKTLPDCEIICVDGGSTDNTLDCINAAGVVLIQTEIASRAGRLNAGIIRAKADTVVLHHPRSLLNTKGLNKLNALSDKVTWGAFTHRFDAQHPLLKFTSWYSNHIRGDMRSVYYLDHCLFAKKQLLLDVGMLPLVDIFEDTELCLRLQRKGKGQRLPFISETSAIRFQVNGIYKQAITNQYMKWLYYFKRSDTAMNRQYEKGMQLNTQYNQSQTRDTTQPPGSAHR